MNKKHGRNEQIYTLHILYVMYIYITYAISIVHTLCCPCSSEYTHCLQTNKQKNAWQIHKINIHIFGPCRKKKKHGKFTKKCMAKVYKFVHFHKILPGHSRRQPAAAGVAGVCSSTHPLLVCLGVCLFVCPLA